MEKDVPTFSMTPSLPIERPVGAGFARNFMNEPVATYAVLTDGSMEMIRQIVREEVRNALTEAAHEEKDAWQPRLVRITGEPTAHIEFERDGVLWAGEVYPVRKEEDA